MAELRTCENGHYYDPDIYPSCPYCTGMSTGVDRGFTAPPRGGRETQYNTVPSFGNIPTEPVTPMPTAAPEREKANYTTFVSMLDQNKADNAQVDDSKFVVGWLAVIEGPYRGKSFEIHNGYTDIGRTEGDIILALDSQVSGAKNVSTVYDAKNNCFFVYAGVSRNLVYVNGRALIAGGSCELEPYSSIQIGGTKMLFVPFCSPQFNWRDGETPVNK